MSPEKINGKIADGEIVCGIDPGYARLGYSFIKHGKTQEVLEASCIETSPGPKHAERLEEIMRKLSGRIEFHKPKYIAIERVFFAKNQKTAMQVAEIRGAVLFLASSLRITIKEFAPSEIKLAVTGSGAADKKAVKKMVELVLKLKETPKLDDITDALAIALCAIYSS